MQNKKLETVSNYYSEKLREFGATPKGVDWNSKDSQYLRFHQINNLIREDNFSILDYGCGTGDFYNYLSENYKDFRYEGFDVSTDMVNVAKSLHQESNANFTTRLTEEKVDYVIGSGIFNVRFEYSDEDWKQYIFDVLNSMNKLSVKGFSFNVLSMYSDIEKRRPDLYYADSLFFFDWCKKNVSRFVTLLHDYPLYEFTIIVRK